MSRSLTATTVREIFSQQTGEAWLVLLTIDHATLGTPIRVGSDGVAVWRRGSATALADAQTNLSANNGSLSASATFRPGILGAALQRYDFANLNTATIPDRAAYSGLTNFTLECWLRQRALGDTGVFHSVMTKASAATDRMFFLSTRPDPNRQRLLYSHGRGVGFTDINLFDMTLDRWHHVAVVKSGDDFSFWIDGAAAPLNPTATITGAVTGNAVPWQLRAGSSNAEVDIDELRLWNVARSQAQIQSTMNVALAGNETGLIGYWPMDDGEKFIPFPFALSLPHDVAGELPRARLEIDNVDRRIVEALRLAAGSAQGPSVLMEIVRAAAPDTVEAAWPDFYLEDATYDVLTVGGELKLDVLEREPYPADSYTPSTAPGVFA